MTNPAKNTLAPWLVGALTVVTLALHSPARADEARRVEAVQAWLAAFDDGVDAMAAVRAAYYDEATADQRGWRPQLEAMRADLVPIRLEGILATGGPTLDVIVESPQGPLTLSFEFDGRDRIVGLRVEKGHPQISSLPPLDLPADPRLRSTTIDAYIENLVAEDLFAGAVLIADPSGEISYQRAFGLASREYAVPNRLSTRFDVGSINKDYTHLALLLLARDDKVDLDAKVGRYLPDYPQARVRDEVTLRQLIEHRSGVPDYFDDQWARTPMRTLRSVNDYLPVWAGRELISDPGSSEHYSNFGYTILGAVIEAVSGTSYPDFVQRRIFDPVGMVDTGFFAVDAVVPDVATGYTRMGPDYSETNRLWKNIYLEPAVGGPWGKSYSTVADLYAFYQKLFRHQILPEGQAWFGTGPIDDRGSALGGGGPGLNAMMALEDGWMVIVLANLDPPSAEDLAQVLVQAVRPLG